jgi:hypothetical protein
MILPLEQGADKLNIHTWYTGVECLQASLAYQLYHRPGSLIVLSIQSNKRDIFMNEAELILAVNEIASTMLSEEALFYTQLSAYLVVAYLAGEKLTVFQVTLINFLFLVATGLGLFGVISFSGQIEKLFEFAEQGTGTAATAAMYGTIIFRLILLIGAFIFMWQVRHPKTE